MAGHIKLDGAGIEKMKTLDEAVTQLQRIHGLVETYAIALKRVQAAGAGPTTLMPIRRALPTLASLLKGQFGMISDQVMALNLVITRGANDQTRLRIMREGIGSLRQALEIAMVRVKENHAEKEQVEERATG